MNDNNRIKEIKEVYYNKFLKVFDIRYETRLGNIKSWICASRKELKDYSDFVIKGKESNADVVAVIGYDEERESLVLIKEYRVILNDYLYSFPAGLVDSGEDVYESARREMLEETGLDLYYIDEDKSDNKCFASAGMTDESISIVYGKVSGNFSGKMLEESEIIEHIYVNREEAKRILKDKTIKIDAKVFFILSRFVETGAV